MSHNNLLRALFCAGLAFFAGQAAGQGQWPSKPVKVVVPFPAGGTNDIVGRLVMRDIGEVLGQPFVIDNRAGASGVIGAEIVAKSPPDGHTIMVHSVSHVSNAFGYKKLPYDTFRDFEPVSLMTNMPGVLVLHPSMPVKTVREFIALAKARPNQITFASNGEGANLHVQMALFTLMTGIDLIHVPYKGGVPVATSLASGETQSSISTIGIVLAHIKSGRLRPVAVTAAKRSTILPELPTIADSGVPGYEMSPWVGVFAPANTPAAIVERLHTEVNKVIMRPEFARVLAEQALERWPASRQEFAAQMKSDYAKFERIFRAIGAPKS